MNKRPDITEATRQRFVDAFCELYKTKPVEKITVKELAERAGHNRVTFYQYFRDAYDVLESLENELLDYVQSTIIQNIESTDMFVQFETVFDGLFKRNNELIHLLLTGANYSNTLERCKTAMLPMLANAFGINCEDLKRKAVLEFYLSGVVSLLKFKVDHEKNITAKDLGSIIKTMLQYGVFPQLLI